MHQNHLEILLKQTSCCWALHLDSIIWMEIDNLFLNYFIYYFWLCWVFVAACRLFSRCGVQGLLSSLRWRSSHCGGAALIVVASPVVEHRLQGSAQQSKHMGLVAPWHVNSSQITRDGNHVPCIGRQHLNHGLPGKSKNFHFRQEALYSQQKQDQELTLAQIMNSLLPNSDWNWRKWRKPLDHSGMMT